MPAIEWENVLRNYRIDYVDKGRNVKRGNININCPFCGKGDTGFHLGLDLDTGYWGCWRDKKHRGRKPHRLLMALLKISFSDAEEIVSDSSKILTSLEDLKSRVDSLSKTQKSKEEAQFFPENFQGISECYRAKKYLVGRGFRRRDIKPLERQYRLRFAESGEWSGRLIFPVIALNGRLIGWTGRATYKTELRYLAYPAGNAVKYHAFNGQNAKEGGKVLVIVEGPVDALKIDYYGQERGVRAIALMSTSMKPEQAANIIRLSKRFKRVRIMFDVGVASQQLDLPSQLPGLSIKRAPLLDKPKVFDDPGAIPYSVIDKQISLILKA